MFLTVDIPCTAFEDLADLPREERSHAVLGQPVTYKYTGLHIKFTPDSALYKQPVIDIKGCTSHIFILGHPSVYSRVLYHRAFHK